MRDWASFNADVIAEFRANNGVVARFGDLPLVIVHTVGTQSGTIRETPLIPVFDDGRMLLFGTAQGAPTDPAWCHNLRANPVVDVEDGVERYTAEVFELGVHRATEIVTRHAEITQQLAEYLASAAPRAIPVFDVQRA
jgi:deazaflavin-dependent oxidoreductase (nitroreductase family)